MPTINYLIEYLQKHIGPKNTAYIAGLENVDQLKQLPFSANAVVEMRLSHAYEAVRLISEAYDDKTAKSWFFGNNTRLPEAPAYVLRHAESLDDIFDIIPLAREFSN